MPRHTRHASRTTEAMRRDIASLAAKLMAEDGIDNYGLAKRKAARQLGAPDSAALPTNQEIEEALEAYQALYQEEELHDRLLLLRRTALDLMTLLAQFRPYLRGPVLEGNAGRYATVNIDLYADSAKEVEIFLLDHGIDFEPADHNRNRVHASRASHADHAPETRLRVQGDDADFLLSVYPLVMERRQHRNPHTGQTDTRLGIPGLVRLLDPPADSPA